MSNNQTIDEKAKDILFRSARTYNGWLDKDVPEALLKQIYELTKYGPTSANCCPARFKFITSDAARERLKPHMAEGNVDKTMSAPVNVVIAYDKEFYEKLPKLFPHTDARSWFVGNQDLIDATAMRNGTLQAAYFILAARGLGLDCGPMSGFDADGLKEEFFKGENVVVDLVVNLGYGDTDSLFERSPRFDFDEICEVL